MTTTCPSLNSSTLPLFAEQCREYGFWLHPWSSGIYLQACPVAQGVSPRAGPSSGSRPEILFLQLDEPLGIENDIACQRLIVRDVPGCVPTQHLPIPTGICLHWIHFKSMFQNKVLHLETLSRCILIRRARAEDVDPGAIRGNRS